MNEITTHSKHLNYFHFDANVHKVSVEFDVKLTIASLLKFKGLVCVDISFTYPLVAERCPDTLTHTATAPMLPSVASGITDPMRELLPEKH